MHVALCLSSREGVPRVPLVLFLPHLTSHLIYIKVNSQ